jgi:hypothetical protein
MRKWLWLTLREAARPGCGVGECFRRDVAGILDLAPDWWRASAGSAADAPAHVRI